MTAVRMNALNAQVLRDMAVIAEDESMMQRVARYLRRVVKEMTQDHSLMSKEEFYAKLDRGEAAFRQGKCYEMLDGEDLDDFLNRVP